jgi:3-deoxy-manno-octulosonate cytidylyltransferase (CMP-KDO synthetase)
MTNIKSQKVLAIIPARMGSTRFPGKPMAKIMGKPMIGHVYENVANCDLLTKTVVATCDLEIKDYIESINGNAIMTGTHHERASDRCAEALGYIENLDKKHYDIIVMVQGDEPMVHPEMIREVVQPMLENDEILVANLLGDIESIEEFEDKNCIKVVCDKQSNALYFSREPIPTSSNNDEIPMKKQICIIPFRRDFLLEYTNLTPTPLEIAESIDMMRVLEYGLKVKMIPTRHQTHAVDTKNDLAYVEKIMGEGKFP